MNYRIGIDVGGTNTDAVLIDDQMNVIAKYKASTTEDIMQGIQDSISSILRTSKINHHKVTHAMLGTTQCTNAIVERRNLNKVGVIRIGKPATTAVPPLYDWPQDLLHEVGPHQYIVSGGYEYNGEEIVPLDLEEVSRVVKKMANDVEAIAVTGVHSPVRNEQENLVSEIIRDLHPSIPVSLSHEIGSIGLLERENATVLNASLQDVIKNVVNGFKHALSVNNLNPHIFLGQNDGTLMEPDFALKYPIFTIGCGPTNSIRGAVHLSGLENAMIIDVGGTTTDIGVVHNGFPRESSIAVEIGGVRTNFRMPDILSVGIGGGTIIHQKKNNFKIGPESVGHELTKRGITFGGDTLTATDIAIGAGIAHIPGAKMNDLDISFCKKVHQQIIKQMGDAVDRMKTSARRIPVVLTGGGSILLTEQISGVSHVATPDHFEIANAIGAAISDVSGETEKVYSLDKMSYEDALEDAKKQAIQKAKEAKAQPDTINIVAIESIPLAYMPGNATIIKVKAVGQLNS